MTMPANMNHRKIQRQSSVGEISEAVRPRILKRANSVSSVASVASWQTTVSLNRRDSTTLRTVVTPLVHLPGHRKVALPVNRKLSLPVITPNHEKLQRDFYQLKHSMNVLQASDDARRVTSDNKSMKATQEDYQSNHFTDYLQRLKLKDELPWKTEGQGQKVKIEKNKHQNKKVYFHFDLD